MIGEEDEVQVAEPEAVEAPEAPEAPPQHDPETVEDARLFGWKSPEEWQGDLPDGYIDDPQQFLDRVQRSRIFKAMQQKVEKTETAASEQARKLETVMQRTLERQKAEYERELAQVRAKQRQAVEDADPDAYDAARTAENDLLKQAPPSEAPAGPDPYVLEYENTDQGAWLKDPYLRQQAVMIVNATPGLGEQPAQKQVEVAEQQMRRLFPHLMPGDEPAPKKQRAMVDGGGLGSAKSSDPFSKLPADAKSAFQTMVKQGVFKDTKEQREFYANEYNAA